MVDIYIRALHKNDAYISFKWRNDSTIWEYTVSKPDIKITKEIELEWINKVLKRTDEKRFAICIKGNDKYIGNVQLTNIANNKAEFHIFIGNTDYWGKGVGGRATKMIIDYSFKQLQLTSIFLYVRKENIRAIETYKKVGFKIVKMENEQFFMKINNANVNE